MCSSEDAATCGGLSVRAGIFSVAQPLRRGGRSRAAAHEGGPGKRRSWGPTHEQGAPQRDAVRSGERRALQGRPSCLALVARRVRVGTARSAAAERRTARPRFLPRMPLSLSFPGGARVLGCCASRAYNKGRASYVGTPGGGRPTTTCPSPPVSPGHTRKAGRTRAARNTWAAWATAGYWRGCFTGRGVCVCGPGVCGERRPPVRPRRWLTARGVERRWAHRLRGVRDGRPSSAPSGTLRAAEATPRMASGDGLRSRRWGPGRPGETGWGG
jgi:hypothetical protein